MPYIGNDIVDLQEPGNLGKSRDARFLKRVFTPVECLRVLLSGQADRAMWSLWAAKETAFKVMRKRHPEICSRPRRYGVLLFPSSSRSVPDRQASRPVKGVVTTPEGAVYVQLLHAQRYVHCIGTDTSLSAMGNIQWQVNEMPAVRADESQSVREDARRHLAQHFHEPSERIDIRPSGRAGAPSVYFGDWRTSIDLSLSHDGRFTAHAFLADAGE